MQYLVAFLVLVGLAAAVLFVVNRPQLVVIDAPIPADFPADGFSHRTFERLLSRFVNAAGDVDYASWQSSAESLAELEGYLAAVSFYSPESTPGRFENRNAELAYWMYAYNAYVIKSVLDHWPIESVTDVKAPLEAIKGLGFFYRLRYSFGGDYLSLMTVENQKIRQRYQDPRIHFVLSCASESCPIVRPDLPYDDDLDELLTAAAVDFVANPANVAVDHEGRQIVMSRIFKWYKRDFVNFSRLHGLPGSTSAVDYVRKIAPQPLANELARAEDYDVIYRDYDWSLNAAN